MLHGDNNKANEIPKHIAIIMDGNGRWARSKFLPRQLGHSEGVKTLRKIVTHSIHLGIEALTVYAFSTENWSRPEEEVKFLMGLMERTFNSEIDELDQQGVAVKMLGETSSISMQQRALWESAEARTKDNNKLHLNVAFNYGGRNEIVNATRSLAQQVLDGTLAIEDLNEQQFSDALYTKGLPDPDLIIRTGGEYRMSNFLLWQAAYAEWYFTPTLWPDFSVQDFEQAVASFANRERRFGRVVEKQVDEG